MLNTMIHLKSLISIMLVLAVAAITANPASTEGVAKTAPPVDLQLAVSASESETTLAFILTNKATKDLLTVPPGNELSYLTVTYPNGTRKKLSILVNHLDVTTVQPSGTVVWKRNINAKQGLYSFTESGLYRFQWEWREFKPRISELGQIYQSNEILVLREGVEPNSQ